MAWFPVALVRELPRLLEQLPTSVGASKLPDDLLGAFDQQYPDRLSSPDFSFASRKLFRPLRPRATWFRPARSG
jgi:hypothetical protein